MTLIYGMGRYRTLPQGTRYARLVSATVSVSDGGVRLALSNVTRS